MKLSRIGAAALCAALCVGTIQILTELYPLVLVIEPGGLLFRCPATREAAV